MVPAPFFFLGHADKFVIAAVAGDVHPVDGNASYRIVLNAELLCSAIKTASENAYDIFHLSCHGSKKGRRLADDKPLSWAELADCFQKAHDMPKALILSMPTMKCKLVERYGISARAFRTARSIRERLVTPSP
jgi:hypothetical protein